MFSADKTVNDRSIEESRCPDKKSPAGSKNRSSPLKRSAPKTISFGDQIRTGGRNDRENNRFSLSYAVRRSSRGRKYGLGLIRQEERSAKTKSVKVSLRYTRALPRDSLAAKSSTYRCCSSPAYLDSVSPVSNRRLFSTRLTVIFETV